MPHNEILRDEKYLSRLGDELYKNYKITTTDITPAKRGYYGETWKVQAEDGRYFLKMDYLPLHKEKFRCGLSVVDYLSENGIDFVGKIVKTYDGRLFFNFDTAFAGLFELVDGEDTETDDTKIPEYQMLCRIYALTKPGLNIPEASFSDGAAEGFFRQWESLKSAPRTDGDRAVLALFERFKEEIKHCARRLSQLAARSSEGGRDLYITHGDAGGNFFIGNGRNYIFDWDEAMYAAVERDAWVMGCFDWARKLFDDTLEQNGIPYRLRPERIAYYCYHMYFFYLVEFLAVHPLSDKSDRIADYLENGWIKQRIEFADKIV